VIVVIGEFRLIPLFSLANTTSDHQSKHLFRPANDLIDHALKLITCNMRSANTCAASPHEFETTKAVYASQDPEPLPLGSSI
jgi:ribosomal protein S2